MIKNIIFDFGGVLFNIDYFKTEECFKDLGYENFNEMYSQYKASDLFANLETGHITAEDFLQTVKAAGPAGVSEEDIIIAWCAMLLGFRKQSFLFLEELKKTYNLYLLSNTNIIHYHYFHPLADKELHLKPLEKYFTKAWYSHEIGYRKPNPDIFEYILQDGNLEPEETLFVEDTEINLPPARSLGMKTHLINPGDTIEKIDFGSY